MDSESPYQLELNLDPEEFQNDLEFIAKRVLEYKEKCTKTLSELDKSTEAPTFSQ